MVSGSRFDSGTQYLPALRKTIQSIKEIVGNHSEADIYSMLKETNMDPNETAQKLLTQDPFHEVKRRRDKKKENLEKGDVAELRNSVKHVRQVIEPQTRTVGDRNARRGGYYQNTSRDAGITRQFRIVKDNRGNQNINTDMKAESPLGPTSIEEQVTPCLAEKSSSGKGTDQRNSSVRNSSVRNSDRLLSSQGANGTHDSVHGHAIDVDTNSTRKRVLLGEKVVISNLNLRGQAHKSNNSSSSSATLAFNNSVVGVYSKFTDPVHVPSPDSRSYGKVGAIKREVGVVGVRLQSSQHEALHASVQNDTSSIPLLTKASPGLTESLRQSSPALTNSDQLSQAPVSEPVNPSMSVSRSFSGNQQNSKPYQQPLGHQKASQINMEWKPKPSKKLDVTSDGVSVESQISLSSPIDNSRTVEPDNLSEKLSRVDVSESQHVIIPQHLRVAESERSRLTFGSFGAGFDSSKECTPVLQTLVTTEEKKDEPATSISLSNPTASSENVSGEDAIDLLEDQMRTSESQSPTSAEALERTQPEKRESSSPQGLGNHSNATLVRSQSPSYVPAEHQQQQNPVGLPGLPGYDSQNGYEVPLFRPTVEENVPGQGLTTPQEGLSTHVINAFPPSSLSMMQQQQPVTQLYPQVHISHFPNFIPYRQILSPVYVPPMAVPNYSNNPAYPHPSNGNSYVLMPGGGSQLSTGNLKYVPSQYKPVPLAGPTGYGNYSNPTGYTTSTPGTVGGPTGLDDVSRIKYKEGNLFIPNQQAETSEIWIQNPRELHGMQSAPFYNVSAQTPHAAHAAFMPSHAGPNSFNAPAQPPHIPFPGVYHPAHQASITNPHHLVHHQLPGMGANVGVAGQGAQVGAYQQPQVSHLNWTTNF